MFDFDALPPFDSMRAFMRSAGIRPMLLAYSFVMTLMLFVVFAVGPWLDYFLGRAAITQVDDRLYEFVLSPANLLYGLLPGYLVWSFVRLWKLHRQNKDYALFSNHGGWGLLSRGDDLAEQIRGLRISHESFVKRYGRTPEPGTLGDYIRQCLEKDWYAVRKAAWELHRDQMELRVRHAR